MNDLITINGVEGYLDENGVPQLNLEHVARGLGFTQVKGSAEYVRWERVYGHLVSFGFSPLVGKDGTPIPFKDCELPKYIPEPIFYLLCMKAENETAQGFQRMVAFDILPAIRRTGGYIAANSEMSDQKIMARALMVAQKTIAHKDELISTQAARIEADRPKVLFAESVDVSDDCILVGTLATFLKQNGVDIGEKRLFAWLRENGYLIRRKGADWNLPTQKSLDLKIIAAKERTVSNPGQAPIIRQTPIVTGKGQLYFLEKFLGKKEPSLMLTTSRTAGRTTD